MDRKAELISRLRAGDPGWPEYAELVDAVASGAVEFSEIEYLGGFYECESNLVFAQLRPEVTWPDWLPPYVQSLYGMIATTEPEMDGGYAGRWWNELAQRGGVFSPAGNDADLGYPIIEIPPETYSFQGNESGASFFINRRLEVLYPNSTDLRFEPLEPLEDFTRTSIRQVLQGESWFRAYAHTIRGHLVD